jgi:hypothetical protein
LATKRVTEETWVGRKHVEHVAFNQSLCRTI